VRRSVKAWACPKCLQVFWGTPHWDSNTTTEYVCNGCFYRLLFESRVVSDQPAARDAERGK